MGMLRSFVFHNPKYIQPIVISENSTDEETTRRLSECEITFLRNPGGSHAQTVDAVLREVKTPYALVVDTDIIFNDNIESLVDTAIRQKITLMGEVCGSRGGYNLFPRVHPWFMIVNVNDLRKHEIKFYSPERIEATDSTGFYKNVPIQPYTNTKKYDVGATFYEDIQNAGLKIYDFKADPEYFTHLEGMSWHLFTGKAEYIQRGGYMYRLWEKLITPYKNIEIKGRFKGI